MYVYILRYVRRKVGKNTKKPSFSIFFAHITGKKAFSGRKSCSDDHTSIFIIVAQRINFPNKKSHFSQLLLFLRFFVSKIAKNAENQPFLATLT